MKRTAFTLVETIITIAVFGLVWSALMGFILWGYKVSRYSFAQSRAINEARYGIKIMVMEIREAQGGEDGSYPIEKADDFEFIFYSDIDKDARIERVRYFLDGNSLKKGVIEPSGWPLSYPEDKEKISFLSRYVRNGSQPIFSYYNQNWPQDKINNPLPPPARLQETKLMNIYLKINVDPKKPQETFELESDTQLRNLKTNL